jgi:hypothetical protein
VRQLIHFIPIVTTIVSLPFALSLWRHWRKKPDALYLLWWFIGVLTYAAGTTTESLTTLFGWHPVVFKAWYITGAFLGGAPLAQGTIYLLMKRRTAHLLTAVLLVFVTVGSVLVILSPIDLAAVETYRLSGKALGWQWVRAISPFINIYAVIFLIGGAAWSALEYAKSGARSRMWGNIWIMIGAILPGIGGSMARAGVVEVLYVTELAGLLLIWLGYRIIVGAGDRTVHRNQVAGGNGHSAGN